MKPKIIKDLLVGNHITVGDVRNIARSMFNGKNTAVHGQGGLEGYVLTACSYDDLPVHVQGFIVKAILEFQVQNFLDVKSEADSMADDDGMVIADSKPRHFTVDADGNPIRKIRKRPLRKD